MTKTNFLNYIKEVNFNISPYADDYLVLIQCNEVELLNLAGGIPQDEPFTILLSAEYDFDANSIYFSSESSFFFNERLLFWNDKFIDNYYLSVFSQGRGVGTFILINQIIQARKLGLRSLKVSAARSEQFNGFYTWARLGYSIDSPDDQEEFDQLILEHGRSERSLQELMQSNSGRDFWKQYGFWWQGQFDLNPNSENIMALNKYLNQAGINILL